MWCDIGMLWYDVTRHAVAIIATEEYGLVAENKTLETKESNLLCEKDKKKRQYKL